MNRYVFVALCFVCSPVYSAPPLDTMQTNDLVYGLGQVEVNTEISSFANLAPNTPIQASVMVTHPSTAPVDINSFRMGDKPLQVVLVQTVPMSALSNIVLSIYKYQIDGLDVGSHTFPPIKVKVGGKEYEALPLNVDIGQ